MVLGFRHTEVLSPSGLSLGTFMAVFKTPKYLVLPRVLHEHLGFSAVLSVNALAQVKA